MVLLRVVIGAILAVVVTLALFVTMYSLIKTEEVSLSEDNQARLADVIMETQKIEAIRKEQLPDKPDQAEEPPPEFEQPKMQDLDVDLAAAPIAVPVAAQVKIDIGPGMAVSDGEYLPIVKVAPVYPRRAQTRGIQGYCTVEYTVTKTGGIRDPQPVDCNPKGVFERASVDAAMKFKYKPRIVDGAPIEVAGVQNRFTYQLKE